MRHPKRRLSAGQIRTLRSMRKKLLDMACMWEDIDEYNRSVLSELADRIETTAIEIIGEEKSHGT